MWAVRVVGVAGVAGAGGAAAYGKYKYDTDEGFKRAVRLYSEVGPVVAHYRWVQFKQKVLHDWAYENEDEKAQEWISLDKRYSGQVVTLLKDLRGMYTKYGQIGAGMTNTLSEEWTEKLRELEDNVPPQPINIVFQTIREETGKEASEIFSFFDEKPLGSASIGQVHRAKLRATGEEVAVKVQYPDSRSMFRQDMETIRNFFEIAAPEQVIIMDELERSFEREFDYKVEAENLAFFHKELKQFSSEIVVPKPIQATSRMLIMELLKGRKLVDGIRSYGKVLAESEGKTLEQFEHEIKEKIMRDGMPERYVGPSGWKISLYQHVLRVRDATMNLGILVLNAGVSPFSNRRIAYYSSAIPPNAPRIMDCLMKIHGYQLLHLGAFNADPHAGNFMLLDDDRIGLIDFGATKVMTRGERLAACVLYASIYKQDKKTLMDMVRVGGYRSKYFDEQVIWDLCRFGFDSFGKDILKDKNVQQFMDDLYARDPWYEAASNLTMAQFLSIRLRSVGMSLLFPIRCSEWWGPLALQMLEEEGLPYETWNEETMKERFGNEIQVSKGATITKFLGPSKSTSD